MGNHYGLFANMTKKRLELCIEVAIRPRFPDDIEKVQYMRQLKKASVNFRSQKKEDKNEKANVDDKIETANAAHKQQAPLKWRMVEFKYKAGSPYIAPKQVKPFYHMPRIDW